MSKLAMDQKWDRMRAQAEDEGALEILAYMNGIEAKLKRDVAAQQARFDSYMPKRPADEPHDKGCQVTRMGPQHCCTCESNMTRRRQQVINAARANDRDFRETLGGMESHAFDLAVKNKW
jgi:hypothetical protein